MISNNFIKWVSRVYSVFFFCLWVDLVLLYQSHAEKFVLFNFLLEILTQGVYYFLPIIVFIHLGWIAPRKEREPD